MLLLQYGILYITQMDFAAESPLLSACPSERRGPGAALYQHKTAGHRGFCISSVTSMALSLLSGLNPLQLQLSLTALLLCIIANQMNGLLPTDTTPLFILSSRRTLNFVAPLLEAYNSLMWSFSWDRIFSSNGANPCPIL